MRNAILVALLVVASPLVARAQNQAPVKPVQAEVPRIDPEAKALLDSLETRYGALQSYSDKCEVKLENAEKWPQAERERMTFAGTLAFERPSKLRFEGKNAKGPFLFVNDGTTTHILNPEHGGTWLQRPQSSPLNLQTDFSRSNVGLPEGVPAPLEGGWIEVGPALEIQGYIPSESWKIPKGDFMVDATFEANKTIDGQECRVVRTADDYGTGSPIISRFCLAKSDGLLRRYERTFGEGKNAVTMVETHSDVRPNPTLPAETWNFPVPAEAKQVDRFPERFARSERLKLKVGEPLPLFSQDGINGEAVELNPKSGRATVVYFFFAMLAASDGASLERLQAALGPQNLHIVGAAGDAKRERVQALITKNKFQFPVYYDEKAFSNQLASTIGVWGWPLILLFDREGKLQVVAERPGDAEFVQALHRQFPDVPERTIVDALRTPAGTSTP